MGERVVMNESNVHVAVERVLLMLLFDKEVLLMLLFDKGVLLMLLFGKGVFLKVRSPGKSWMVQYRQLHSSFFLLCLKKEFYLK